MLCRSSIYCKLAPLLKQVAATPSEACLITPLPSEQKARMPLPPTVAGVACELYVETGVPLQFDNAKS